MLYDTQKIIADNPIKQIIGEVVKLDSHHKGLCPFHKEKTPSFYVYDDHYYCYGCAVGGDVISFTMHHHGVDFQDACKILGGELEAPTPEKRKTRVKKIVKDTYAGITPVVPVPVEANLITAKHKTPKIWNPNRSNYVIYKPSMAFEYHNSEGQLIGYVLRVDFADGGKMTPQIMWCEWGEGEQGWCHYTFPEPRPLYGVVGLSRNTDAPVMIVEGEKCKDSAHRLLKQYACITWAGGTNAVNKADWRSLAGRNLVVIWPDNDEPGEKAAVSIRKTLLELGVETVKVIGLDPDHKKGWDVADAESDGLKAMDIVKWAKPLIKTYQQPAIDTPPAQEQPPIEAYEDIEPSVKAELVKAEDNIVDSCDEFRCLGHLHNVFYYLPSKTSEILSLTPNQHKKDNFTVLADEDYWIANFSLKKGVNWDWARQALINRCCRMGYFDGHALIRGRGAWIDEGRSVLHLGRKIIVDGKEYTPRTVPSKYVYEGGPNLSVKLTKPATNREAHALVELCNEFVWEKPISGHLLAGWCIIASVCGIFKWRPHIWLTGAQGTGKTTIQDLVCKAMLEGISLNCDGLTTEAGIRHMIRQDAIPVIQDEAEAQTQTAQRALQGVLGLARTSSSGGKIIKGTSDGKGMSFSMRSSFCWASINSAIEQAADKARISKLVLMRDALPGREERWNKLNADLKGTFTTEYAGSMFARTFENIKTLQANVGTFAVAANRVFSSARLADQIGTMLAGMYLCYSTKEITVSDAVAWIQKQDWSEVTTVMEKPDDTRLLDTIATTRVRIIKDGKTIEPTIGELILEVDDGGYDSNAAHKELKRYGLMIEDGWLLVANNSTPLGQLLCKTVWHADWSRSLMDVDHAEKTHNVRYFSPGISSRAVRVPVAVFREEEK